jgi:hypothetical protein
MGLQDTSSIGPVGQRAWRQLPLRTRAQDHMGLRTPDGRMGHAGAMGPLVSICPVTRAILCPILRGKSHSAGLSRAHRTQPIWMGGSPSIWSSPVASLDTWTPILPSALRWSRVPLHPVTGQDHRRAISSTFESRNLWVIHEFAELLLASPDLARGDVARYQYSQAGVLTSPTHCTAKCSDGTIAATMFG